MEDVDNEASRHGVAQQDPLSDIKVYLIWEKRVSFGRCMGCSGTLSGAPESEISFKDNDP